MELVVKASAPKATVGLDALWRFASERQRIYMRRLRGETRDLTDDPVLAEHRFTNPYRAADRVSQYLITDVIYDRDRPWIDTFARVLVFKIFNRIDTWRHLLESVGEVDASALFDGHLDRALAQVADHRPIYSSAYIMPPPRNYIGPKYVRHLSLLRSMINDRLPERIAEARGMRDAFRHVSSYGSIGPFLAYQFITDLNYTPHLSFSEREFVVPGPGAVRGIKKCFSDPGDYSAEDLIRYVTNQQDAGFEERGLDWHDLWGRELQLIDVQNLFCEVDKYTRAAHPELCQHSPEKRIKQKYRPISDPLTAWFPPKWGLNKNVPDDLKRGAVPASGQVSLL